MAKKKNQYDEHHRKPKSLGGGNENQNTSYVRRSHHVAWHILFPPEMPLEKVVAYINRKFIDPAYYLDLKTKGEHS